MMRHFATQNITPLLPPTTANSYSKHIFLMQNTNRDFGRSHLRAALLIVAPLFLPQLQLLCCLACVCFPVCHCQVNCALHSHQIVPNLHIGGVGHNACLSLLQNVIMRKPNSQCSSRPVIREQRIIRCCLPHSTLAAISFHHVSQTFK